MNTMQLPFKKPGLQPDNYLLKMGISLIYFLCIVGFNDYLAKKKSFKTDVLLDLQFTNVGAWALCEVAVFQNIFRKLDKATKHSK